MTILAICTALVLLITTTRLIFTRLPRYVEGSDRDNTHLSLPNVLTRPFSLVEHLARNELGNPESAAFAFDPTRWNTLGSVGKSACYGYILNIHPVEDNVDTRRLRPGYGSGITKYSWGALKRGVEFDGLIKATWRNARFEKGRYLVAAAFDPRERDFHFWVLHKDGEWGNKVGELDATNLDSGGRRIRTPRRARTFKKYWFVGYFWYYPESDSIGRTLRSQGADPREVEAHWAQELMRASQEDDSTS